MVLHHLWIYLFQELFTLCCHMIAADFAILDLLFGTLPRIYYGQNLVFA